jgi:hypothetical protein
MLGGRKFLANLVAGEMHSVLKAFLRTGSTADAYPQNEGCVVNGEGFLSFRGICMVSEMEEGLHARGGVDELLKTEVLSRGLLLKCPTCQHSSFVHINRIGSTISCQRCLASHPFEQRLWRLPLDEPTWYYDLHPIARGLVRENGDVPLLLAEYLRRTAKLSYTDASEFLLLDEGRNPVTENDLLALVDRQLILAEAKSSNHFGGRRERSATARKRVFAAKVLCVDEILLGTTQISWDTSTVEAMRVAIGNESWPTGQPPRLRTICGLGSHSPTDTHVAL